MRRAPCELCQAFLYKHFRKKHRHLGYHCSRLSRMLHRLCSWMAWHDHKNMRVRVVRSVSHSRNNNRPLLLLLLPFIKRVRKQRTFIMQHVVMDSKSSGKVLIFFVRAPRNERRFSMYRITRRQCSVLALLAIHAAPADLSCQFDPCAPPLGHKQLYCIVSYSISALRVA